jgi:sugar lactone lactonase YvrE
MDRTNAELVVDARCGLGEGPVWDGPRARLWWTDIDGRTLWRFDPVSLRTETYTPPDRVGFLAVATGGRLLLGTAKALYIATVGDAPALDVRKLADVEADLPHTRVNDGRADRDGNVVFGTMDERHPREAVGSFYQYSSAHGLRRLDLPRCRVANSICFSPDGRTLYFTDTSTGVIRAGDYDAAGASVTNLRDLAALPPDGGHPDGSIVDADGCVWNAAWGGAILRRFTPEGRLDREIAIPSKNPTCPAFGDVDLSTIYVTTSRNQHTPDELAAAPHAGGLFTARVVNVRGLADALFIA